MSNDSVERVCEVCNQEIPKWKSKGTTVCSVGCRFKRKDQRRQKAQAERRKTLSFSTIVFIAAGSTRSFRNDVVAERQ
jgi:predicted nucleic acid-binding Zn ribbon protein